MIYSTAPATAPQRNDIELCVTLSTKTEVVAGAVVTECGALKLPCLSPMFALTL